MKQKRTIVDVPGIKVGHAQNEQVLTGCTVVLAGEGATAGVDVRGSAPGTRETDLLRPENLVEQVHAICLCGGSAFGLDACSGVMQYLEEQAIGLDVGVARVPIVSGAVLFDLPVGDASVRPDRQMGYQAAAAANCDPVAEGNVGAGTGASVGKLAGFERAMKSGIGSSSIALPNGLIVGAIVAVNAVGEIRDPMTNQLLAGARDDDGKIKESRAWMLEQISMPIPPGTNTTIAVVASNANLNKAQANKVAQMAHDGLARTIHPVHTMYDGDTIFALATGGVDASVDLVGSFSADVLAEAVVRAIWAAVAAGGLPACRDLLDEPKGWDGDVT
ncbi:P1 family peptidase [Brevibacillus humidisoli]|uniref:P1 family peptidase n=1 Tax=Brevibacillus humidisoli TaxID=2895522 RepID=UPI001E2D5197|nr:P1 family peptidase [Brevibacillus humidisoli]UFJ42379.1 P1 family peptidase [Brevibacillus humidisoli]